MATLRAEHLAKSYKGRTVVRDVSLEIRTGQIVGLLGPNGAGEKTTCFYMIVGIIAADQGNVSIDDRDITPAACARTCPRPASVTCRRRHPSFAS
jgi:lipopolysaccharide export system ATP-binding protein